MDNRKAGYKRPNQKQKALLIAHILLKYTDEHHKLSLTDLQEKLELYGVEADVHTIGRDIRELTELFNPDAEFDIDDDERPQYKIVYDRTGKKGEKGFKIERRPYDFEEIQLLAECVNSAKFITEKQAERFREIITNSLCSIHQAEHLNNEVFVFDRPKTKSSSLVGYFSTITEAIRENKKIKFKYLKYDIDNLEKQITRRKGDYYIFSPFKVLSNEGNFYLLAYGGKKKKMITTFRIDRMKDIKIIDEPREGNEEYKRIDFSSFTRRVFSMYRGENQRVQIRFTNNLLDAVVERFGVDAFYKKIDDKHFSVSAEVEVSDPFFGWICGFGKRAVITSPDWVVEKMKAFITGIQSKYELE